jgi:predicted transposase YbfD/YdcC
MPKEEDIFAHAAADRLRREAPLARRVAPRTLDDLVGQDHLLAPGKTLRRAIEADRVTSLILYGPPGSGKTALALKGNHETVHDEVKEFFADAVAPCATQCADTVSEGTVDFHQTIEKNHGRVETRRWWQSSDLDWCEDKARWKGLKSIGMVKSIRAVKGKSSIERRYFLSSLPLDAENLAKSICGHWGVENSLHWSLDVTFKEDDSRGRTMNAAQNVATLRRIALNLVKETPLEKTSQRQRLLVAGWDSNFLKKLLGFWMRLP